MPPQVKEPTIESLLSRCNDHKSLAELDEELDRRLEGFSTASLKAAKAKIARKQLEVAEREIVDHSAQLQALAEQSVVLEEKYALLIDTMDSFAQLASQIQALRAEFEPVWNKAHALGLDVPPRPLRLGARGSADYPTKRLNLAFQQAANSTSL
jgi:hypothetical protein